MNSEDKDKIKSSLSIIARETGKIAKSVAIQAGDKAKVAGEKAGEIISKSKDEVFRAIDQNGDGEIGIEDIIMMSLKAPGIRINRAEFLNKELFKRYPKDVIDKAIATNPAQAGIKSTDIDQIASDCIEHERILVTGISAALGTPGGIAMVATIPADITQYYGYMLRAIQELLYLYGFKELNMVLKN